MALSEEKALVARWKQDPQAFGEVFDTQFSPVFHYILHRVADAECAEELAARTFFNALNNLWRFRWNNVPVSAWLFRIATNEVNGHLRKRRKRAFAPVESMDCIQAGDGCRPDAELVAAEEEVARHRSFLLLHSCIQELKPKDQSLIALRYFENKPFSEIARILGQREGSLRMRTVRALEKLKKRLQDRGISDEEIRRSIESGVQARGEGRFLPARPATQSP